MDFAIGVATVALSALGAGIGSFLAGYFTARGTEEGKIDAIQRNLATVLAQQEVLAAAAKSVEARLWLLQEHWKNKAEVYSQVLAALAKAQHALDRSAIDKRDPSKEEFDSVLSATLDLIVPTAVARLWLPAEICQSLEGLGKRFVDLSKTAGVVPWGPAARDVFHQTLVQFQAAAREELQRDQSQRIKAQD
jgi:hypothetical protein